MNLFTKSYAFVGLAFLSAPSLFGELVSSTPSMGEYAMGHEKIVIYTDVPGHTTQAPTVTVKPGINLQNQIPLRLKSNVFQIRIKSAATDGQWVECFANYTYNRGDEIEDIPQTDGSNSPVVTQNYQNITKGWSHTFTNFEMTQGSLVELEISLIGTTTLNSKNFIEKFAVHPFDKAKDLRLENGKIYFTIDKPSQLVIDINGQMDDHNAAINPMVGNPPAHGLSIFANPILAKPTSGIPGIVSMAPGDSAPAPSTFDTLIFQPGVHNIGLSFPLYPGKSYYIPGDAVLLGTFSNLLSEAGPYRTKGDSIRMFGYGVISGAIYTHYLYPNSIQGSTPFSDRVIVIEEGVSCELFGLTINDPANHSMRFFSWSGSDQESDKSYSRWMKPITWRANGDGIGGGTDLEDCFFRTADDSTYATGNRRRCVFWKDVNAALFHMPDIPSQTIYLENCDVIYNRLRTSNGTNGAGFQLRDGAKGIITGNTIIRNIRFLDKRSNMPAISFNGVATPPSVSTSFKGVSFENISIEPPINSIKQSILGDATAPWFGGLIMKNVTIGGVTLTDGNFDTYFTRNEWVDYIQFNEPANFTLTTQANPANGEIRRNLMQTTYPEKSQVVLTGVAKPGESVFSHWSGDASGSTNPLTIWMTDNKTIVANFRPATIHETVVIKDPGSGTWTVPAGVFSATIEVWGGGGAGGSAYNGNTSGTHTQARGGGGAGGSYASTTIRVSAGQTINYTVGAGGIAAPSGFPHNTDAEAGGASNVTSTAETVLSQGGPGGQNISVSNQNISGTGGTAPNDGNIGMLANYGGNGGSSNSNGTGGGGGSAGSQGPGGNGSVSSGGSAGLGGGAGGASGGNSTNDGKSGTTPGSGGAGAAVRSNAFFHRTGGNGGTGQVIIRYNTMTFTLTTNSIGNGSVTLNPPGGTYISATPVEVTAVAPFGYQFTGWSGSLSGMNLSQTISMNSDQSITATFAVDPLVGNVWDGGSTPDALGNFNWSDESNWIFKPPVGGALTFAGTVGTTTFNDLAADTSFTGITFTNTSGAFTLAGSRITLDGDIINQGPNAQSLNMPMVMGSTRTFNTATGDLAMRGILSNTSGTVGLTKSGPAALSLFAANTYNGTTAIQNGMLTLTGGNNRLPASGAVILGTGAPTSTIGILQLGDSNGPVEQTLASITIPAVDAGATNRVVGGNTNLSTLTINNSSNFTFSGSLGGPGTHQNNLSLTKTGSGLLALRATNTFSGLTEIQNGAIEIGNGNDRLPITTSLILGKDESSGVLQLGNTVTARSQTLASITTSGTGTGNRVVSLHGSNFSTLTINNVVDATYDGMFGGPNANNNRLALTKNGGGTLILTGTHTHFGINTLSGGILQVNQANGGLGDSTAANALNLNGGTLSLRNNGTASAGNIIYGSSGNPLGYNFQLSNSSTINVANLNSNIGNSIQLGILTQASAAARTLHVTGAHQYQLRLRGLALCPGNGNTTTINSSTANLIISGNVSNLMSGFGSTNFNTLTLSGNSHGNLIQGIIGDAVGASSTAGGLTRLSKIGDSTWELSGTNIYDGATSVNAGTLLITGDSSAANGSVTINGGTLGGTGTIGGAVTLAAAGSLAPGNTGAGTLTFNSNLNIAAQAAGTGRLKFELNSISTSDKIVVSGSLTIGPIGPAAGILGFNDFNFTSLPGLEIGTYKLIIGASSVVGELDPNVANRSGILGTGIAQGTLQFTGNDLELHVVGLAPGPVTQFSISPITSPQTIGMPITDVTITALDASSQTATDFHGIVQYGGSGGFGGTSPTFTAGVLTGVTITPTIAGSNLTFTVHDAASHTGTATINTIRTQYQAWASTALFEDDANHDGVKNGLAWLLGAASPATSINLPVASQDANGLTLTFNMLNEASRGTAAIQIEHSSELGNIDLWTSVTVPETTIATPAHGVTFVVTPAGHLNKVVATISSDRSATGKLFGRVKGKN